MITFSQNKPVTLLSITVKILFIPRAEITSSTFNLLNLVSGGLKKLKVEGHSIPDGKKKNFGAFFFLAKCFHSMPKKEKFSKKNQRGPGPVTFFRKNGAVTIRPLNLESNLSFSLPSLAARHVLLIFRVIRVVLSSLAPRAARRRVHVRHWLSGSGDRQRCGDGISRVRVTDFPGLAE